MASGACVLSAFVKTHLQVIDERLGTNAGAVRSALDAEVLLEIEKSPRVSWTPLAHHLALTESLFASTTCDEAREICRGTVNASFEQPFLKPIVSGAIGILGSSFDRFVTWTPKAWPALFRGTGNLIWLPESPGRGSLRIVEVHPEIAASAAYVEGLAGAFSALFDVTGCRGRVSATVSQRNLEFVLEQEEAPTRP